MALVGGVIEQILHGELLMLNKQMSASCPCTAAVMDFYMTLCNITTAKVAEKGLINRIAMSWRGS